MEAPLFPIIYVRGYAMTESERDETASDPFCGFNDGSTVYRADVNKSAPAKKFIFESPVLRLASDFPPPPLLSKRRSSPLGPAREGEKSWKSG